LLFFLKDDASVVGAVFALSPCMSEKSLEERVSAIEAQLGNKTLEQHFREQAELIDRRFAESFREQGELIDRLFVYRFDEFDAKWDAKLDSKLANLEGKLETKFDAKIEPIKRELAVIKHAVKIILTRLP
jgi:hypothetical protein